MPKNHKITRIVATVEIQKDEAVKGDYVVMKNNYRRARFNGWTSDKMENLYVIEATGNPAVISMEHVNRLERDIVLPPDSILINSEDDVDDELERLGLDSPL